MSKATKTATLRAMPVRQTASAPAMRTEDLLKWMLVRESIRKRKEAGLPKPWTADPIFQRYRFCNVPRERDNVTR